MEAEADDRARRRAQEEFARPLVVEAGAGTGKTAVLTARLLAWALGPGWDEEAAAHPDAPPEDVAAATLQGVLAITFTEAAAAEMAERVTATLEAVARGEPPDWLQLPGAHTGEMARRARHLSAALDHLDVSTIHAFCLALLRENSLAAGLHPAFAVDAEGQAVIEAIHGELAAWLPEAVQDPAALELAAAGCGLEELAQALSRLVAAGVEPEQVALAETGESLERTLTAVRAAVEELLAAGGERLGQAPRNLQRTHRAWQAVLATRELLAATAVREEGEMAARVLALWPSAQLERLADWASGNWGNVEARLLGEAQGAVARAALRLDEALHSLATLARPVVAASRVLATLLGRVRERLRRQGAVSFQDLLAQAHRLLATQPVVLARQRARLRQVLVDEFQDTDVLQCELVTQLCLAGDGRRPGLFVVGDPKQSIYAWRNADLAAYQGFLARVREAGGEVHQLTVNFRSVPPILQEVERSLAPLMGFQRQDYPHLQAPFQALLPCPQRQGQAGFQQGRWAPVEYWQAPKDEEEGGSPLAARAVAADVAALHRAGVRWEQVGVLLRTTGELETYLEALRQFGVPYATARDRSYYRRREVIEAAALLRTVVDPSDHVALLTWLRSPLVGVPDAALLPLWRAGLPRLLTDLRGPEDGVLAQLEELVEKAAKAVPVGVPGWERVVGWQTLLLAGVKQLAELRFWLEREPFPVWLERLRQATWLEAGEAARYLGGFRLANLAALFSRLEREVEQAGGDHRAVLVSLRRLLAEEGRQEGTRGRREAGEGVQVMTIHGAKGLDFDHVYLVEAHRRSRSRAGERHAVVRVGSSLYLKLAGLPWPGWEEGERLRTAMEEAELVRTLYVAMTRARERLVIVGDWEARGAVGRSSHLGLLRHRRPELSEPSRDAEGWGWVDEDGARWVWPPKLPAPVGKPAVVVAQEEWRPWVAVAQRLHQEQENAAARLRRPRGGTVTGEAQRHEGEGLAAVVGVGARAAAAAGTAVHAALAQLDLHASLLPQLARAAAEVSTLLPVELGAAEREAAVLRAGELLQRLTSSPLLERLGELADGVIGREVPLLLPAEEGGEGPLGFLAGALDLLYRDPSSGELVVADFKTDALPSPAELEGGARRYRRQGELYCRAVQEALALPDRPHFEIWWLTVGQVQRLW